MGMFKKEYVSEAFVAAVPIILGYVAIGIPCGLLASSIGLNWLQVLLMCLLFYSGAGQFMIPNMFLAGSPLSSIVASVSFVNTRQMLYSASLAPYCEKTKRPLSFLFAATVTDESFGVSMARFEEGNWSVERATWVNLFSQTSWTLSNVLGAIAGGLIDVPLSIASFAMTSIFICLMCTQKMVPENIVAMMFAMLGVCLCKVVGLSGPAILLGAIVGVVVASIFVSVRGTGARDDMV